MQVLVTGGTGFIGRHLLAELMAAGHTTVCLVRESSDTSILPEGTRIVRGNVADKSSLLPAMQGCDWVANLANLYEFWVSDPREYRKVNVEGTRNVMEAALEAGISKIVHVSTLAAYGNAQWPITEETEEGDTCFGDYPCSKREGDAVVWHLRASRGLPVVMIYPGAVIGPGDPKAAGRYLCRVLEGTLPVQVLPDKPFPFVSVVDVARGIGRALEKNGNIGERYLLAAESPTFGEINQMMADISGTRLPRLALPDWLTIATAHLCTCLARLLRRPPVLDMAIDQMRLMKQGMRVDGRKAERELGLRYQPIREVLRLIVDEHRTRG